MVRTLVLASLVAAVSAGAQSSSKPRVGYAASPTPPAPQPAPQYPPVYYVPGGGYVVTGVPYVVLSDGSVAVNFGNGYERVLRPCAQQQQQSTQASTGRDALGRILPPPGIAALQAGSRGQITGTTPAPNASACYRTGAQGRLEMGR